MSLRARFATIACGWLALVGCACSNAQHAGPRDPTGHQRMLDLLVKIRDSTPDENPYLGDREARELRARLAGLPADAPAAKRFENLAQLGEAETLLGHEREAIRLLKEAHAMLPDLEKLGLKLEVSSEVTLRLGVAYMRLGETQNCCLRHSPDSCVLPIRGGGVHQDPEGSRTAIGYFTEVLQSAPKNSSPYLSALWLMNVAYQTLGEYPQYVPAEYVIPPTAFRSSEDFPRFPDIAGRLGLDAFQLAGGAIADDFDNDGDLDLMVSTLDTGGQLRLWVNQGDGSFSDETARSNLTGLFGGLNLLQADYDNDGDLDALVLRGAWWGAKGRHPKSLLRNNGDGTFTDVTFEAGLGQVHYPSQTASWADYDNDGDLDLAVGNETTPEQTSPCQLFRNEGDGTFTDVAAAAGIDNLALTKAVVWGDYDNDRFPDLYVSSRGAVERLYHNNRDGTFTDVAPRLGVTGQPQSFPTWFWDVDNDGNLDLWVSSYATTIPYVAAYYLGLTFPDELLMKLYRGDGHGGFEDVSRQWGLDIPASPMGSNFGDLDNDGWLDFYLGTGDPNLRNLMPNLMFHNREGKGFVDVTFAGGFGNLQKGHAVVFADFDNDGDQDVFEQMGGAIPADRYHALFFENPGFGNHWIAIQAVGVTSNRAAIGTRIRVDVVEDGKPRTIYKTVNSGGTFGANPLRQTIGLGRATKIERVELWWPRTGETQVVSDVPLDGFVRIVEGSPGFKPLDLRPFKLGGAAGGQR